MSYFYDKHAVQKKSYATKQQLRNPLINNDFASELLLSKLHYIPNMSCLMLIPASAFVYSDGQKDSTLTSTVLSNVAIFCDVTGTSSYCKTSKVKITVTATYPRVETLKFVNAAS